MSKDVFLLTMSAEQKQIVWDSLLIHAQVLNSRIRLAEDMEESRMKSHYDLDKLYRKQDAVGDIIDMLLAEKLGLGII
jgi:hypothetical protein